MLLIKKSFRVHPSHSDLIERVAEFEKHYRRPVSYWFAEPGKTQEVIEQGVETVKDSDPEAVLLSVYVSFGDFSVSLRNGEVEVSQLKTSTTSHSRPSRAGTCSLW